MPSLNKSLLRRDGYLFVRNVIPADRLDTVREACEGLLERQREVWRREAGPDDPPGGTWEKHMQPRVPDFHALVDKETAPAVELWLSEPVMGTSRELLSGTKAIPMHMMMMCNPRVDHGPAKWHRDIGNNGVAPLWLLQEELAETGPRYLQWNLPLYDDDVFWVVPGSHRRLNTPEEDRRLRDDPRSPLPGGMPVKLEAGDGLIYYHSMLHWGSNYSTKLRRTVHGGISVHAMPRDPGFTRHLSPSSAAAFRSLESPRGGAAGPDRAGAARNPGRRRGGLSRGPRELAPRRRSGFQAHPHGLRGRSRGGTSTCSGSRTSTSCRRTCSARPSRSTRSRWAGVRTSASGSATPRPTRSGAAATGWRNASTPSRGSR